MVDFDLGKAVAMTMTGIGATFVALLALMALTSLMGRYQRGTVVPQVAVAPVPTAPEAPAPEAPRDGVGEDASSHDPKLVAAVAAAVAMAANEYESEVTKTADVRAFRDDSKTSAWKSFGR